MKKKILFIRFGAVLFATLIGLKSPINDTHLDVDNNPLEENAHYYDENVKQTKNKRISDTIDNYDIVTYDIYGHENSYFYDDFDYNENISLESYNPDESKNLISGNSLPTTITSSPYDKYYSLPYSAICTVYTSFDINGDGTTDVTYVGTGTLVGPDVVMTAEENTYNTVYGYPTALTIALGAHKNASGTLVKPFGQQSWISITRGVYHSTFDANDNWALIRINSKIGYTSGWLGVSDTGISNNSTVFTLGYASTSTYVITAYQGIVSSLGTYKFNHSDLPPSMANGAPVMNPDLNIVYGIQCGTKVVINNITYSQACKVSIYIKNWVQEDGGPVEVTVFALHGSGSSSSNSTDGHAWLTIKNKTPYSMVVGKMTIVSEQGVSLGTWGNKIHSGLYYNLEYYLYNSAPSTFSNRVSYTKNMFLSKWDEINEQVNDNDEWSIFDNCSTFAIDIWNTALPQYSFNKPLIPTPKNLKSQITALSGYLTNKTIIGTNKVGYYNGSTFVASVN